MFNKKWKEDDFQEWYIKKELIQIFRKNTTLNHIITLYPKVRSIGGKMLNSEMDLIITIKPDNIVWGYEFKYLKYITPSANYVHLYKGMGQLFNYPFYGVERAVLCVGISKEVKDRVIKKCEQIVTNISNVSCLMKTNCFGYDFKDGKEQRIINGKNQKFIRFFFPSENYPIKNIRLSNEDRINILNGKVGLGDKNWLHKRNIPGSFKGVFSLPPPI